MYDITLIVNIIQLVRLAISLTYDALRTEPRQTCYTDELLTCLILICDLSIAYEFAATRPTDGEFHCYISVYHQREDFDGVLM